MRLSLRVLSSLAPSTPLSRDGLGLALAPKSRAAPTPRRRMTLCKLTGSPLTACDGLPLVGSHPGSAERQRGLQSLRCR